MVSLNVLSWLILLNVSRYHFAIKIIYFKREGVKQIDGSKIKNIIAIE